MKKRIKFQFEGKVYTVDIEREGNSIIVEREGESYTVTLLPEEKPKNIVEKAATVVQPQPVVSPTPTIVKSEGVEREEEAALPAGVLVAPITGMVKEIKIAEGQRVQKGQTVIIMEAMKMDIDLYAPVSGIVQSILVSQGENVKANQQLLKIE